MSAALNIGDRVGRWTVVDVFQRDGRPHKWVRARCDQGHEHMRRPSRLEDRACPTCSGRPGQYRAGVARIDRAPANVCTACGKPSEELTLIAKRCPDCAGVWNLEGTLVDPFSRYEDDPAAQLFVAHFAGGATLEEVGEAFGLTRERIRQIEEIALRKLIRRCELVGITADDVAEMLRRKSRVA